MKYMTMDTSFRGIKRRERTKYSKHQLSILEAVFQENHYPDTYVFDQLCFTLNLHVDKLATWFQNRRCKEKRVGKENTTARPKTPTLPTEVLVENVFAQRFHPASCTRNPLTLLSATCHTLSSDRNVDTSQEPQSRWKLEESWNARDSSSYSLDNSSASEDLSCSISSQESFDDIDDIEPSLTVPVFTSSDVFQTILQECVQNNDQWNHSLMLYL